LATKWVEMDEPAGSAIESLMRALDVNERVARALVGAGMSTLEKVAFGPLFKLVEIDAIEMALLLSLRKKARKLVALNAPDDGDDEPHVE
jgi:hypothetical protein